MPASQGTRTAQKAPEVNFCPAEAPEQPATPHVWPGAGKILYHGNCWVPICWSLCYVYVYKMFVYNLWLSRGPPMGGPLKVLRCRPLCARLRGSPNFSRSGLAQPCNVDAGGCLRYPPGALPGTVGRPAGRPARRGCYILLPYITEVHCIALHHVTLPHDA